MDAVTLKLREFNPEEDQAFIYATWRNSLYYGSDSLREKDPAPVFKQLTIEIKKTLRRAQVLIACDEAFPYQIAGYVVFTGTHLDWVYVKEDYRRQGVATLLVPKNIETVPDCVTKIGKSIIEKKLKEKKNVEEGIATAPLK